MRSRGEQESMPLVLGMAVGGIRPRRRPQSRFMDTIQMDMRAKGMEKKDVQDRVKRRRAIQQATR